METEIDKSGMEQLAAVYGLLAKLWVQELDAPTLRALAEPPLVDVWRSLGGQVPADQNQQTIDELAADYCQLLIGPSDPVSPVQSIWMEDRYEGSAATSMQQFFDLLPGYRPPANIRDHIGNQFDYLGELFARAANDDYPETYTGLARNFMQKHLAWTSPFFAEVEARAETDFYRGLARVTRSFLDQ